MPAAIRPQHLFSNRNPVGFGAYSPDGALAVTCHADHLARIWDMTRRTELRALRHGERQIPARAAWSPDGRLIATSSISSPLSEAYYLTIWDAGTGETIHEIQLGAMVGDLAFAPNGRSLIAANWRHTNPITIWNVETGEEAGRLGEHHASTAMRLAISPDGQQILYSRDLPGKFDNSVHLWDVKSGQRVTALGASSAAMLSAVAFSPDGRHAAAGGSVICLWDLTTLKPLWKAPGHKGRKGFREGVCGMAFSRDGKHLLWGDQSGVVHVLDTATGKERLECHEVFQLRARAVSFCPDRLCALLTGHAPDARILGIPFPLDHARERFWVVEAPGEAFLDWPFEPPSVDHGHLHGVTITGAYSSGEVAHMVRHNHNVKILDGPFDSRDRATYALDVEWEGK